MKCEHNLIFIISNYNSSKIHNNEMLVQQVVNEPDPKVTYHENGNHI